MHHTTILLLGDCTYLTYRRDMFFALNENMWFQSHLPLHLVENEGFLSSKIEHTKRRWFCKFPNMGICPLPAPQFWALQAQPNLELQSNNNFLKNDALSKDCKTTDFCNKQTLKQQATELQKWVNERRHSFALYAWIWWMMDILCLRLMVNKIMGTWKKS